MVKSKVLVRKINTFVKIDIQTKIMFIKAFIYTCIFRIYILFVPFNKLRSKMGNYKEESLEEVDISYYKVAKNIRWIVRKVAAFTPWESKCLVQALTAQRLMKEYGISTTIYLGVKKESSGMLAHAWIRCGRYIITGGENRNGYTVVAKFTN